MRFGLIGAGGIGKIRADALAQSAVCELTAVSDLDETRARAAAPGKNSTVMRMISLVRQKSMP